MTTEVPGPDLARSFRRRGIVTLSLFALAWAAAGVLGVIDGAWVWAVLAGALAMAAATIVGGLRAVDDDPTERPRRVPEDWQHRFNLVGIAQGVAIALVVVASIASGRRALIPAAVCLVVGVHFWPLAGTFDESRYRWTAGALCLVALIGAAVLGAAGAEASRAAVGLGAASALWGTAWLMALRGGTT